MIVFFLIALTVVVLDQLVKWWTVAEIPLGETVFENPILSLTHLQNKGAAWSILEGQMWFFYVVTVIACVVVTYLLVKNRQESKWLTIGLSLILGGALGNFIDRLHLNYVVDMFQVELFNFPIFNVADAGLTLGVLAVFVYIIKSES